MKLKEYAEEMIKLAKLYPDIDLVYSIDDEGNAYHQVNWLPSIGCYNSEDYEFLSENYFDDPDYGYEDQEYEINAICIN